MGCYTFTKDDAFDFARIVGEQPKISGNEMRLKYCPYCKGGRNRDKNTFAINLETGLFNCRRATCGAHGNMITLAHDFNMSLGRDADEYYNIRPSRFKQIQRDLTPEDVTPSAISYLTGRGIPMEIVKQYRIVSQKEHPEILVFPFYEPDGKRISFVKYRRTNPQPGQNKEWCEENCKPILFGMDQCNQEDKTLIMTEGQIDTLSVVAAGYQNCVSVPTGKNGFTWVPHCWDWLQSFQRLIVFGDHEHGEITLLEPMKKRFHGAVAHVRPEDYQGCKDANELLQKHGAQAIKQAIDNAETDRDPHIKGLWEVKARDFSSIRCVKTGFTALDQVIGGMWMGTLIAITGERGNGKSTLGSQLLARALRAGETIFAYSGELPNETFKSWMDRQLSSGNGCEPFTINGRTDYRVNDAVVNVINRQYLNKAYIYDSAIVEDGSEHETILKTVKKAITQLGCTVIMIDNLMSAIEDPGPDLNAAQASFVLSLSKMALAYDVCIILLAHPRKGSTYNKSNRALSNDDVSGSAVITNAASFVLGYSYPAEGHFNGGAKRDISVLKNRFFGDKAEGERAIPTWFDPITKRILEKDGEITWDSDEQTQFVPVGAPDPDLPF